MVDHKDASTLTDVCSGEDIDEVELVSLVNDSLPRYRLRADTVTSFAVYTHKDWGIKSGHQFDIADDIQSLTPLQAEAALDYFLVSGSRLTQMTRTYNDIEAVTRLLEEKEKDLELAAHIGKSLLSQNKELLERCDTLEADIAQAHEQIKQLSHDVAKKEALIKIYTEDLTADASSPLSPSAEIVSPGSKQYVAVQRKLKLLEEDNVRLRQETLNLRSETLDYEEKEHRLTEDCVRQLNDARKRLRELQAELDRKGVEFIQCQEECSSLLSQLVNGQHKTKQLTIENLELQEHLKVAQDVQKDLATELFEIKEKYEECKELLESSREEMQSLRQRQAPRVAASTGRYFAPPALMLPPQDSLAAEIESLGRDSFSDDQRRRTQKVIETAHYVRKLGASANSMSSSRLSSRTSSILEGSPGNSRGGGVLAGAASSLLSLSGPTSLPIARTAAAAAAEPQQQLQTTTPPSRINPLLAAPIPGSGRPRRQPSGAATPLSQLSSRPASPPPAGSGPGSLHAATDSSTASGGGGGGLAPRLASARVDEVEKLRVTLGRSGIPGSGDLEVALRRLVLRRQNEESERNYFKENGDAGGGQSELTADGDSPRASCRTPDSSLSSELSCYGSGSGYGFRMPEKLQIVKPIEGSATLHHWQRLATPHLGGLLECRDGVQIKLEEPHKFEVSSYSLNDPEEDDDRQAAPRKGFERTSSVYTYTTSRVMHPTDDYSTRQHGTPAATTVTTMTLPSTAMSTGCSTAVAGSGQSCVTSASVGSQLPGQRPSLMVPVPFAATPAWQHQQATTSTFSVSLNLATILKERGITAAASSTLGLALNGLNMAVNPGRVASIVTESLYGSASAPAKRGLADLGLLTSHSSSSSSRPVMSSSIF